MTNKLSKNILIYGGTNAIKSLVPFLMLPILTSYLSVNDYGTLSIVEASLLFLTPFILLNVNSAINVEYFLVRKSILKLFITNSLILTCISFVLILLLFLLVQNSLSSLLHISNELILMLPIFAFLRVVSSVVLAIYQVSDNPVKYANYTIIQTLIDFMFSYVFIVFMKYGYEGRLYGTYLAFFLASLYGIYILYTSGYLGKINFRFTKSILLFGTPLIPHAIGGTVIAMSDRYFISYFIGNEEVGYYTVAYQISALMLLVSMSLNQAWSPMLFAMLKNKDFTKAYKFTVLLSALCILSAVIIYMFKDLLFTIFVTKDFFRAKDFFGLLLLGFLFQSLYFFVSNFIFFEKKTAILAKITFSGAILNVVLNYYLLKEFGTIGVAYATAITWLLFYILVIVLNILIYKKGIK